MLITPPTALSPVEHRAAVAAGDLDALDRIERNGRQIDLRHVDIVEPATVDQDERVGGGEGAEAAQIDRSLDPVCRAAEQRCELHAGHLGQDVGQVGRRRMRDFRRGDHGGGGADDAVELPPAGAASGRCCRTAAVGGSCAGAREA
jgi:hypothetical protein